MQSATPQPQNQPDPPPNEPAEVQDTPITFAWEQPTEASNLVRIEQPQAIAPAPAVPMSLRYEPAVNDYVPAQPSRFPWLWVTGIAGGWFTLAVLGVGYLLYASRSDVGALAVAKAAIDTPRTVTVEMNCSFLGQCPEIPANLLTTSPTTTTVQQTASGVQLQQSVSAPAAAPAAPLPPAQEWVQAQPGTKLLDNNSNPLRPINQGESIGLTGLSGTNQAGETFLEVVTASDRGWVLASSVIR